MAKKTITIRYDPKTVHDDVFEDKIEADVKDGFAIHPSVTLSDIWTITHVKSGLACSSCETKQEALAKRKMFARLTVAGVRFADMEACEALAIFPVLAKQFLQISHRDVNEKTMAAAIANRDYISKVICKVAA